MTDDDTPRELDTRELAKPTVTSCEIIEPAVSALDLNIMMHQ